MHNGDLEGVTLWENSGGGSFAPETISLSQSVRNFKFFVIEFQQFSGSNTYGLCRLMFRVPATNGLYYTISYISQDVNDLLIASRAFLFVNDTQLSILAGYDNKVVDNRIIIPRAIYGIK